MAFVNFFRSMRGQAVSVIVGCALIVYGAIQVSLAGLVLMMIGVVPTVIGLAGICLREEVATTRERFHPMRGRRREDRAQRSTRAHASGGRDV